jgi:hypothetical protein
MPIESLNLPSIITWVARAYCKKETSLNIAVRRIRDFPTSILKFLSVQTKDEPIRAVRCVPYDEGGVLYRTTLASGNTRPRETQSHVVLGERVAARHTQ